MIRKLLAVLLLSGCQGAAEPPPVATSPQPPAQSSTTTAAPTPTPVTSEGDCPYLDTGFVEQTVGQRIERRTYTTTSHELIPSCTFFRPDGEPAVSVVVTAHPTARQAQSAALDIGTAAASPVEDIADGGVVLVEPDRTVLAVTSGRCLLVVSLNQASSLEARAIAAEVAPVLG